MSPTTEPALISSHFLFRNKLGSRRCTTCIHVAYLRIKFDLNNGNGPYLHAAAFSLDCDGTIAHSAIFKHGVPFYRQSRHMSSYRDPYDLLCCFKGLRLIEIIVILVVLSYSTAKNTRRRYPTRSFFASLPLSPALLELTTYQSVPSFNFQFTLCYA